MTNADFAKLRKVAFDARTNLLNQKNADYASEKDVLSNFKTLAEWLNTDPYQIWAVYAMKHVFAIMAYCKGASEESEPIEGRIADLQNYLDLLLAMIAERKEIEEEWEPEYGGVCN